MQDRNSNLNKIQLDDHLSVSSQITADDVALLAQQGVVCIINNRPDGEDEGQPESDAIKAACEEHGIDYFFIPAVDRNMTDSAIESFNEAMDAYDEPIHAYCRSGTRCSILWSFSQARDKDVNDILAVAAQHGYDLSSSKEALEKFRDEYNS